MSFIQAKYPKTQSKIKFRHQDVKCTANRYIEGETKAKSMKVKKILFLNYSIIQVINDINNNLAYASQTMSDEQRFICSVGKCQTIRHRF